MMTIARICYGANPLTWVISRLIGNFLLVGAIVATAVNLVN
jgi:hypothetical protein